MDHFDERQHRSDGQHQDSHLFDEEAERKKGQLPAANQRAADAATKRMVAQARGPAKPASNEPFTPGTELYVSRTGGYHHSGVYVGNSEVVHVFAEPMSAAKALLHGDPIVNVVKTSLSKYLDGASQASAARGPSPQKYSNGDVINRANAHVGEGWSYNPLTHNCQHFTSQVVSGAAYSPEAAKIQGAFKALPEEVQHGVAAAAEVVGGKASEVAGAAKEKLSGAEHAVEHAASSVAHKAADVGKSVLKKLSFW